ncbi:MAG: hypothetical protein JXR05_10400 [Flavobacteriaceae bacterium]
MTRQLPFGDADANNVNLDEIIRSFIPMNSKKKQFNEVFNPSTRVIFGKKGAGKTLYLRGIRNYLKNIENPDSIYVTDIDNQPPDTELITKISSWYSDKPSLSDELWRKIWEVTIVQTTITHILYSKELSNNTPSIDKDFFLKKYKKILPKNKAPNNLFNQLTSVIEKFNSAQDLNHYLRSELWGSLLYDFNVLIKNNPPIYFFLDQLDDDFINSPHSWLSCQYGLFNTIFRFLRNNTFGRRLHIIVCLREFVYAYILNGQHGTKYLNDSKIVVLKWNQETSKYFLNKKVENLNKDFLIDPSGENSNQNFFGFDNVKCKRDKKLYDEKIEEYIVRHTQLMPRDIINIGNTFYEEFNQVIEKPYDKCLKIAVRNTAKQIAFEQLKIASLFLSTKWMYNGVFEDDNVNIYNEDYVVNSFRFNLEKLIKSIGKDRFTHKTLMNRVKDKKNYGFEKSERPFNSLFLSGLLGYVEEDESENEFEVFFSESRTSQYEIPLLKKKYVFHSCLIDYLNIKPIKKPVYATY